MKSWQVNRPLVLVFQNDVHCTYMMVLCLILIYSRLTLESLANKADSFQAAGPLNYECNMHTSQLGTYQLKHSISRRPYSHAASTCHPTRPFESLPTPQPTFEHIQADSRRGRRVVSAQATHLEVAGILHAAGSFCCRAVIVGVTFATFDCKANNGISSKLINTTSIQLL